VPVPPDKGDVTVGADWAWQSLIYNTATHQPAYYDETQPFGHLSATVGWMDLLGHDGLSAWLFAENLNQNRWDNGQLATYEAIGLWGVNVARARSYGVRVRMDFK
jgi:hypothetical protein